MDEIENASGSSEPSTNNVSDSETVRPVEETANVSPTGLQVIKQDPAILEVRAGFAEAAESDTGAAAAAGAGGPRTSSGAILHAEDYLSFLSAEQTHALRLLAPEQLALLVQYVHTMRMQRLQLIKRTECAFCKRNGEDEAWYGGHALKDWRGRVLCPVLRAFRCPRCGATGDRAHTIKYCPENDAGWDAGTFSDVMNDLLRESINKDY